MAECELIETEEELIDQMTTPSDAARAAAAALDGPVMILGIAGKMGPTLGELLVRAGAKDVIGVSRFPTRLIATIWRRAASARRSAICWTMRPCARFPKRRIFISWPVISLARRATSR